jgi:hypothetical protein
MLPLSRDMRVLAATTCLAPLLLPGSRDMGAWLTIVLAVVLVTGCANWKGYDKPGGTQAEFKQDVLACRRSAEVYDRGLIPPLFPDPNPIVRVLHDKKTYRECMLSRGYRDTGWNPFRELTR